MTEKSDDTAQTTYTWSNRNFSLDAPRLIVMECPPGATVELVCPNCGQRGTPAVTQCSADIAAVLKPFTAESNLGVGRAVDHKSDDIKVERWFTYGQFRAVSKLLAALTSTEPQPLSKTEADHGK